MVDIPDPSPGLDLSITESTDAELQSSIETQQHIPVIEIVGFKKEQPVGLVVDLAVDVSCKEGCDLRGGVILIGDTNNQVITEQLLVEFDEFEGLSSTDSFSVQIPSEPGGYIWTIVFYPFEGDHDGSGSEIIEVYETVHIQKDKAAETLHAIVQADYSFKAIEHITGMTVWRDSTEPVSIGDDYLLNIGVSCIHGCSLLGQTVNIYCDGSLLTSVTMDEPITPLEGLYQNKVLLTAPTEVGIYTLECRLEPQGLDLSHTSETSRYVLATNKHAQCRLDLLILNLEEGTPIEKASVVVRPKDGYPGYTQADKAGKASIGVPWGETHVGASCRGYLEVETDIFIPEGQEIYELTLMMPDDPSLFA